MNAFQRFCVTGGREVFASRYCKSKVKFSRSEWQLPSTAAQKVPKRQTHLVPAPHRPPSILVLFQGTFPTWRTLQGHLCGCNQGAPRSAGKGRRSGTEPRVPGSRHAVPAAPPRSRAPGRRAYPAGSEGKLLGLSPSVLGPRLQAGRPAGFPRVGGTRKRPRGRRNGEERGELCGREAKAGPADVRNLGEGKVGGTGAWQRGLGAGEGAWEKKAGGGAGAVRGAWAWWPRTPRGRRAEFSLEYSAVDRFLFGT